MDKINSNFKLDSFKIRLPISKIQSKFLDDHFEYNLVLYHDHTGEVVKETKAKTYKFSKEGNELISNMQFDVENLIVDRTHKPKKFLSILVSSKHIGASYYNGINLETMPLIVDYINASGLEIDLETLLKTEVVDVDVCKDTPGVEINTLIKHCRYLTKPAKRRNGGYFDYKTVINGKSTLTGIEWTKRKDASESLPFLKIYSKFLDAMSSKHFHFFEHYDLVPTEELVRTEFTLKNKKHLRKYEIGNKLSELLEVSQDKWLEVLKSVTAYHFDKQKRTASTIDGRIYTDSQEVVCAIMLSRKSIDVSIDDLVNDYKTNMDRNTANRWINKLLIVNNRLLEVDENYKMNNNLNQFFEIIL